MLRYHPERLALIPWIVAEFLKKSKEDGGNVIKKKKEDGGKYWDMFYVITHPYYYFIFP